MSLSISAVVCTYNRRDLLVDAIKSLMEQDIPKASYEIIVVDNASTDGTSELVREKFASVENLRLLFEPKQGLSAARNAAVRQCKSNIAAFIDDDAVVFPDFLRRYVDLFATVKPTPAVIGGEVTPIFGAPRPEWLTDEVLRRTSSHLGWSKEPCYIAADGSQWLCETNSAYRIDTLVKVGGFPESLGRVGDSLLSGEGQVNAVLHHAGYPAYFDPRIVVRHHVPAERMTRAWFRRRAFWEGISSVLVRDYMKEHGVQENVLRPLSLPCAPEDWVRLFDEHGLDEEFPAVLQALVHLGYVVATQNLLRGR
jgi:glycosyltransferase involved in cell wall biosynthesis